MHAIRRGDHQGRGDRGEVEAYLVPGVQHFPENRFYDEDRGLEGEAGFDFHDPEQERGLLARANQPRDAFPLIPGFLDDDDPVDGEVPRDLEDQVGVVPREQHVGDPG
ncbi:MAG: hypothetical protein ACTSUE_03110 [Promethearchaeota archaeon]